MVTTKRGGDRRLKLDWSFVSRKHGAAGGTAHCVAQNERRWRKYSGGRGKEKKVRTHLRKIYGWMPWAGKFPIAQDDLGLVFIGVVRNDLERSETHVSFTKRALLTS